MTDIGRRSLTQNEIRVHVLAALRHLAAAVKLAEDIKDRDADFRLWHALQTLRRVWAAIKQARG